jgi:hypothetical protein
MSSVVVSIALHGLIALVPVTSAGDGTNQLTATGRHGANHMAALLVDAQNVGNVPQEIKCIAEHHPTLTFPIPDSSRGACLTLTECQVIEPSASEPALCSCAVDHQKIWLTPDYQPKNRPQFNDWAPAGLPAPLKAQEHLDFSYIPNLDRLNFHLDPAYLNAAPSPLLARMTFPFDELIPCDLAIRPKDKDSDDVHVLGFRKLDELHNPAVHLSQAGAQRLIAKSTFTITNEPLTLHIASFGGKQEAKIPLVQGGEVGIELQNEREHLSFDDPCNDGIGRDFALFYQLAGKPPKSWRSEPLPHVMLTDAQPATMVDDIGCHVDPMKGLMSRPICTMAAFIE